MGSRYSRYNATQTVDTLLEAKALSKRTLSETSLDATRHKTLATVISLMATANGETAAEGEDRDALVLGWHFLFSHVPTIHLIPLFQSVLQNRNDDYPIAPKNLLHAWTERYEEEEGTPALGYSWFRDEHGRFLPATRNERTGLFPSGTANVQEALRLEESQGLRVLEQQAWRTYRLLDDGAQDVKQLGSGS